MSTRYEWHSAADTSVDWEKPCAVLGDDELELGQYAIVISSDEVSVVSGTMEELERFVVQVHQALKHIRVDGRMDSGFGRHRARVPSPDEGGDGDGDLDD